MKKILWVVFIIFSIFIGLYPISYLILTTEHGVLINRDLYFNSVWRWMFFQHVIFGGIAMLSGFTQFSKKIRLQKINIHRTLGKIYLASVLLGGTAGLFIAIYTQGGLPAKIGFSFLAIGWLFTTAQAFIRIRNQEINSHEQWMIRSYALTWAAVTLRIYLPTFEIFLGMNFNQSYPIIAWLCWVPNLIVAEWIISRKFKKPITNIG